MLTYKLQIIFFFVLNLRELQVFELAVVYCITNYICILEISNFNCLYYSYQGPRGGAVG